MSIGKLYINGKKVGTTEIIEMEKSLFIQPPVTPIVINPKIKEANLTFHMHLDTLAYYEMIGAKMTNNYLKMHGGILQRKARRRKKMKRKRSDKEVIKKR